MSKRVVLIGRGHLGQFLKQRLGIADDMHFTGDLDAFEPFIKERQAEVVINTAGKTSLEWCEANPLEAYRCNVTAPLNAFRACKQHCDPSFMFIHISSGCVWDGPYDSSGHPFKPTSPVTPQCFYSWTKASFDALLMLEGKTSEWIILRPRQVYSPIQSHRNTLAKISLYPNLIDTPNSMTSAETIAKTIEVVLAQPAWFRWPIIGVYDRGITSPYEVGMMLANAGLREIPGRLSKAELDAGLKPKRVDTVIKDASFESLVNPPNVREELLRVIGSYASKERTNGV